MKLSENKRLAEFLQVRETNRLIVAIIAVQVVITIIVLVSNIWLGLLVLMLFAVMDLLIWQLSNRLGKDFNHYIANLSYNIKRVEQEAIIKLPIGIVIHDDNYEIEWLSPYLQSFSENDESFIGKQLTEVFPEIRLDIKEEHEFNIIEWRGSYYQVRPDESLNVIYLENVSEYMGLQDQLHENRSVIGWLFLDNYD